MEILSDAETAGLGNTCDCGEPATLWIETESDYGRGRGFYCGFHGERLLARLGANYEESKRLDLEATARLGYDPASFCEYCGVKIDQDRRYMLDACKCEELAYGTDPVVGAEIQLRTAGEIALLVESEGGRA